VSIHPVHRRVGRDGEDNGLLAAFVTKVAIQTRNVLIVHYDVGREPHSARMRRRRGKPVGTDLIKPQPVQRIACFMIAQGAPSHSFRAYLAGAFAGPQPDGLASLSRYSMASDGTHSVSSNS
jgi:hypothetical protein